MIPAAIMRVSAFRTRKSKRQSTSGSCIAPWKLASPLHRENAPGNRWISVFASSWNAEDFRWNNISDQKRGGIAFPSGSRQSYGTIHQSRTSEAPYRNGLKVSPAPLVNDHDDPLLYMTLDIFGMISDHSSMQKGLFNPSIRMKFP